MFTGAFHAASDDPDVQRFVTGFWSAYGSAPDLFAANGYDAATLLRRAVLQLGHPSSADLRREFLSVRQFHGVTGLSGFGSSGHPRRELRLLRIHRGSIVETGDAPANQH